jgi:membrane protein
MMATQTRKSQTTHPKEELPQRESSRARQTIEKHFKPFHAFLIKCNNDWIMNFAPGLAFSLLTAIFPIVIAIISILGFVVGGLEPHAQDTLIQSIRSIFPSVIASQGILKPVLNSLSQNAGFLGMIAVLLAIFGGSRLFVTIESYFAIMYRTRPRSFLKQNIMAIGMLLVFIVLTPLMIAAASLPALVFSFLQKTPLSKIPGSAFLFSLSGIVGGLLVAWILFEVIYLVIPNRRISFRASWRGAVVAAIALQVYLILFPFYVAHFMNNYTGTAGFAVILLFFFYYFAVILLLGAEVNAFFTEGIRATPDDLAGIVHQMTSLPPTHERSNTNVRSKRHH